MKTNQKAAIFVKSNNANQTYLEEQKTKCKHYAENNGLEVGEIYDDFDKLLECGEDTVLVSSGCRLSRDAYEFAQKQKQLENAGKTLIITGNDNE